jgi:hypothetical protein
VEHDSGEPDSDVDCSSCFANQLPPRPFLSHCGTIARQELPGVFSSIGGPRGRRSRVGLNLSNGLRRWALLVMAPTLQCILVTSTTPFWRWRTYRNLSDRFQSVLEQRPSRATSWRLTFNNLLRATRRRPHWCTILSPARTRELLQWEPCVTLSDG